MKVHLLDAGCYTDLPEQIQSDDGVIEQYLKIIKQLSCFYLLTLYS